MDYAIILGGGKGLRMGSDVPKQFIEIGGLPILMHTILRFREYGDVKIILVLPKDQQYYWQHLCQVHHFTEDYQIADGGSERFFSIKNALALIPDNAQGVVAVHDGVRPFPSVEVIARCFETARQTGTAVPVIPVVETLRKIETHPQPLPKGGGLDVNSPEITATNQNPSPREGHRVGSISLVEGNRENIKITTPFDLIVAEALVSGKGAHV